MKEIDDYKELKKEKYYLNSTDMTENSWQPPMRVLRQRTQQGVRTDFQLQKTKLRMTKKWNDGKDR